MLILGPIRMDQLSELKGLGGLGALGDIEKQTHSKERINDKDKDKEKNQRQEGGDQ